MVSNGRKTRISMVALVITIIVLIVLTSAVVITGVGAPKQAQLAVFKSNIATIQELVGIQMSENMITGALESKGNNYKWQGIVQEYDYDTEDGASPNFAVESGKCNGQPVAHISTQLLSKTTLNSNEYTKYYISVDGIVYHEGMTINGTTYYNENTVQVSGIYGIKRALNTSATTWERTDDSIGKNANATLYGVLAGTNDFDNIYPWSAIRSYNYDVASDTITA